MNDLSELIYKCLSYLKYTQVWYLHDNWRNVTFRVSDIFVQYLNIHSLDKINLY